MAHDESKLPKWVRERLTSLRMSLRRANEELDTLKLLNTIGQDPARHWFTIPGPEDRDGVDERSAYTLFILDPDQAIPVCTLFRGDRLFVGRAPLPIELWETGFGDGPVLGNMRSILFEEDEE